MSPSIQRPEGAPSREWLTLSVVPGGFDRSKLGPRRVARALQPLRNDATGHRLEPSNAALHGSGKTVVTSAGRRLVEGDLSDLCDVNPGSILEFVNCLVHQRLINPKLPRANVDLLLVNNHSLVDQRFLAVLVNRR